MEAVTKTCTFEGCGRKLAARGLKFDIAFTSALQRAQKTCQIILDTVGQPDLRTIRDQALNERDYSSNKPRARVARAIDSLGWDRVALEALASGQVARKG